MLVAFAATTTASLKLVFLFVGVRVMLLQPLTWSSSPSLYASTWFPCAVSSVLFTNNSSSFLLFRFDTVSMCVHSPVSSSQMRMNETNFNKLLFPHAQLSERARIAVIQTNRTFSLTYIQTHTLASNYTTIVVLFHVYLTFSGSSSLQLSLCFVSLTAATYV